jgi:Arc/MetJ-type ribon-helix-helix transcriptional regulator
MLQCRGIMRSMMKGMTRVKIAVSLPEEEVEAAKRAVQEGRARSVSAYVADALHQHGRREGIRRYLDLLIEKYGPPTADDSAWAEGQLARVDELDARGGYPRR